MGYNIQPFEYFSLKKTTVLGAAPAGNDGSTDNTDRTLPYQVHGRPFTIILEDSAGVGSLGPDGAYFVQVQVNNKAYTDPSKKYHNATPLDYGRETIRKGMEADGVIGQLETSLTASDFHTGWIPYPNQAIATTMSTSAFSGAAGWRWVRLVAVDAATPTTNVAFTDTFEGFLYHGGADHTGK